MNLNDVKQAKGLPDDEAQMVCDLIDTWEQKRSRNQLRYNYYNGKNRLKDLGIAIPPPLKNIETVIGWAAKAVDALAVRSRFEGFTLDSGNDFPLNQALEANRFRGLYHQAVTSQLIASCSFLTVSRGGIGDPAVIISAYSALNAAAIWDERKKRIKCGLAVVDVERKNEFSEPEPTWVNLYTDTDIWEIVKFGGGWQAVRHPHLMGRPMMEPLAYRPSLDRPFGKSRISRAVMSISDSAVRTALRTEVSSEFYTAPQKVILGADDSIFENKTKWEAYIGNWLAIGKDEDGERPTVSQLAQYSMQPHIDYMRSLAARFSGETSIPVSELGVISDNPSSAEAIYAAKESLVIEAETLNESNGYALKEIGMMALACEQNKPLDELSDDELSIKPRFKNPAMPSIVSQADAISKIISAIPYIAETRVALEEFGFNDDQITRILADKQRIQTQQTLNDILSSVELEGSDNDNKQSENNTVSNTDESNSV